MKNTLLFLLMTMLCCWQSNAQTFQRYVYENINNSDYLNSGVQNSLTGNNGFTSVGTSYFLNFSTFSWDGTLILLKTNMDGTPVVNKGYHFSNAAGSLLSEGSYIADRFSAGIESYIIAGNVYSGNIVGKDLLFCRISKNGNMVMNYRLSAGANDVTSDMHQIANGTDKYLISGTTDVSSINQIFLIKMGGNGVKSADEVYAISNGAGPMPIVSGSVKMIEDAAAQHIVLIARIDDSSTGLNRSAVLVINSTTYLPVATYLVNDVSFTSVKCIGANNYLFGGVVYDGSGNPFGTLSNATFTGSALNINWTNKYVSTTGNITTNSDYLLIHKPTLTNGHTFYYLEGKSPLNMFVVDSAGNGISVHKYGSNGNYGYLQAGIQMKNTDSLVLWGNDYAFPSYTYGYMSKTDVLGNTSSSTSCQNNTLSVTTTSLSLNNSQINCSATANSFSNLGSLSVASYNRLASVCSASSTRLADVDDQINIENDLSGLSIYPNPVGNNNSLHIGFTSSFEKATIQIIDLTGRVITSFDMTSDDGIFETNFDTNNLLSGIYVLRLVAGDKSITKQIVK